MNKIKERMESLRTLMRANNLDAFITPSTDPHSGEYVPDRWKSRSWISGFTGSAGTAAATLDKCALWTDSRYFLQAEEQLKDTGYVLMKEKIEGTPSVAEWLTANLKSGDTVGVDGWTNTVTAVEELAEELKLKGIKLRTDIDPYDTIWEDRPEIPAQKAFIHPIKYAGETSASKLARIREKLHKANADALLISMLDEVAWTTNLRGNDIEYNPVFVSYLLVTTESATLYTRKCKIDAETEELLKTEGIDVEEYSQIEQSLKSFKGRVMVQPDKTNYRVYSFISNPLRCECPVSYMKIMKNEVEINGYRSAMLKDGIAMVKWMKWMTEAVKNGNQTELSLEKKLYEFRAEQPLFKGESFASIMGYGPHGAIVHYEPTEETDIPVKPESLLLIDSGGQYLDGTTDITRTIPLGPLTDEERRDYTLVLRGFINLGRAHFPKGTCGTQLDCLARTPMWEYGINYLHGTGHGVGSFLNVHEGPHQFRMNHMPTTLEPGMTITDEPGIYIEGKHGVRHENTMLIVYDKEGITFGPYYKFEHLTLCPIFTSPIIKEMMQDEEVKWFNEYQETVYEKLSPNLDEEHRQWLYEITRPI